ncbi:helix-turn-helix transcriptional regulator [Shinella sp.]|uniref:helix-turn-helix transcriptional regulator n=1 Tax=Shinella sp. TaxID=1870904 RepID=UPI003F71F5D7
MIAAIYDAAIEPERWPTVLQMLSEALAMKTGVISLIDLTTGEALLAASHGFDDDWLDRLPHYEADLVALWGGEDRIAGLSLDEPALLSRVNPAALRADSTDRFHREFHEPQGFIDAVAVGLKRDERAIGSIGFNRHRDAGPIGAKELDLIALLVPHLQRASEVSRLLEASSVREARLEEVLDQLSLAVLLVSSDLRVLYANRQAGGMLDRGDVLSLRGDVLAPATPGLRAALRAAIEQVERDQTRLGRKGMGIPAQDRDGMHHVVHVLPLARRDHGAGREHAPCAAIFVASSDVSERPAGDVLAALFGLTPSEARVLDRITAGRTVADIATELRVSVNTIRTHLLHIFEKTGVKRQADLVALSATLHIPLC